MKLIGSREKKDLTKIRVDWVRGIDNPNFLKALIFLIIGKKGSGKSGLVEALGERYPKIIDLFGSRDDEGLAWCRDNSPIDDILLVHGDNVDLDCSWDTCNIGNLSYKKINEYEVTIPSFSFYSGNAGRFVGISKFLEVLWNRREWTKPIYICVREASSFLYSRIKQDKFNMKAAKADFIYWQREMRHFGYSLGIDSIRYFSIDKEMRDNADWQIFKKIGGQGLPKDMRFLYRYLDPFSFASLPVNRFVAYTDNACIGIGTSECPSYHKEEGVDLLKELGIRITYGEPVTESTAQRIGDEEHATIIREYSELKTMRKVSDKVHRSLDRIRAHLHQHNKEIIMHGKCQKCTAARSDLAASELQIGRKYP